MRLFNCCNLLSFFCELASLKSYYINYWFITLPITLRVFFFSTFFLLYKAPYLSFRHSFLHLHLLSYFYSSLFSHFYFLLYFLSVIHSFVVEMYLYFILSLSCVLLHDVHFLLGIFYVYELCICLGPILYEPNL